MRREVFIYMLIEERDKYAPCTREYKALNRRVVKIADGPPTAANFLEDIVTDPSTLINPAQSVVDVETNPNTQYTGTDLGGDNSAGNLVSTAAGELPGQAGSAAGSAVNDVAGGFLGGLFSTAWPWLLLAGGVVYVSNSPKARKALGIGKAKNNTLKWVLGLGAGGALVWYLNYDPANITVAIVNSDTDTHVLTFTVNGTIYNWSYAANPTSTFGPATATVSNDGGSYVFTETANPQHTLLLGDF